MFTTLEAVNHLLVAIGERPVNTLGSGNEDADAARDAIQRATKEILAQGWEANTDEKVTLTPDINGFVVVPDDALVVDTVPPTFVPVRVQQPDGFPFRCLYNRATATFTWVGDVYCRIVRLLDFDALTPGLQNAIVAHAAVRFQNERVGTDSLDRKLRVARQEAWAALLAEESENDPVNLIQSSPAMARIGWRNGPWRF